MNKFKLSVSTAILLLLTSSAAASINVEELERRVKHLKANDDRLVRFNAEEATVEARDEENGCDGWLELVNELSKTTDRKAQILLCDLVTLCVIDHPANRAAFSKLSNIHKTIVDLAGDLEYPEVASLAAHVIYATSFANKENHQAYLEKDAVATLSSVCVNENARPIQQMWAAAALQNLAADYCDTKGDGRCYWIWDDDKDELVVELESLPVISSGRAAREEMMNDRSLLMALEKMICRGPSDGSSPFPGEDAKAGKDEDLPSIVSWAAAGALKNIALSREAGRKVDSSVKCLCFLAESEDWLEELKATSAVVNIRGSDPCHLYDHGEMCVDRLYSGTNGLECSDITKYRDSKCADRTHEGYRADMACCMCGGGDRYEAESEDDDDEEDGDEL